jgi:transcriptional regulator with XRE-family HTH domain
MLLKSFGKVLRQLREEQGLSQESFGFEISRHRTYISQLERGQKSPTLTTLNRICKALQISMSEFLKMVEQEEQKASYF